MGFALPGRGYALAYARTFQPFESLARKLIRFRFSPEKKEAYTSLCYRSRSQPIRTASQIEVKIKISLNQVVPVYQKLAPKIKELNVLGISYRGIAERLGIDKKTVGKGLTFD